MQRTLIKTPAGENQTRYTIRFESDECVRGTQLARHLQFEMLQTFASDPANSQCGPNDFQTMQLKHDGRCWIATFEAIIEG